MDNKVETLMVQSSGFYKDPVKMIVVQTDEFLMRLIMMRMPSFFIIFSHQAFEAIQSNWMKLRKPVNSKRIYQL